MPITVVVGGQYGSEGKGKVTHFLAKEMNASTVIRVGGPNSGHTVVADSGEAYIFRQLPTAAILPDVMCVLPAGSYISPMLLKQEILTAGISRDQLLIDSNAIVIDDGDIDAEHATKLMQTIGSTGSGTGAAVLKRIKRLRIGCSVKEHSELSQFAGDSINYVRERLDKAERIIIEGTQGFGLSLLHSPTYPYVTSRDTTASAFVSEAGLSPLDVDDVVLVIRAFPIRVGGTSGPLLHELDWSTVTKEGGHANPLLELTSVTKKPRRIARFAADIVKLAIKSNHPTRIVLNHIDYLDEGVRRRGCLTPRAVQFVDAVEREIERNIDYVGLSASRILPRISAQGLETFA